MWKLAVTVALVACSALAADGHELSSPSAQRTPLDGTWRLIGVGMEESEDDVARDWEQLKMVADGRFIWTVIRDGKIVRSAGGRCEVRGGRYVEHIDYVLDPIDEWMRGHTGTFRWRLQNDRWEHQGTVKGETGDAWIAERWERVE